MISREMIINRIQNEDEMESKKDSIVKDIILSADFRNVSMFCIIVRNEDDVTTMDMSFNDFEDYYTALKCFSGDYTIDKTMRVGKVILTVMR